MPMIGFTVPLPRLAIALCLATCLAPSSFAQPIPNAPPATPITPPTPAKTLTDEPTTQKTPMKTRVSKTEPEWKETLTPEQFYILRRKGTERAFTGIYWNHHEEGTYRCAGCDSKLFESTSKFDSGCGWPSYDRPIAEDVIEKTPDNSLGMRRIEVLCSRCGGHLGHVFNDGPTETRLRYCINSAALKFEKKPDAATDSDGKQPPAAGQSEPSAK
jgi:peptide-methionine (R)-S-oxide reductase